MMLWERSSRTVPPSFLARDSDPQCRVAAASKHPTASPNGRPEHNLVRFLFRDLDPSIRPTIGRACHTAIVFAQECQKLLIGARALLFSIARTCPGRRRALSAQARDPSSTLTGAADTLLLPTGFRALARNGRDGRAGIPALNAIVRRHDLNLCLVKVVQDVLI